jgi:hypothetical protein
MLPSLFDLLWLGIGIAIGVGGAIAYTATHQAKALAAVATVVGTVQSDVAAVKAKV